MARTLATFRAEKGLYLKDLAQAIDVSEEELQVAEQSGTVPTDIAEKIITTYNLPADYFMEVSVYTTLKPQNTSLSHFFKVALIWVVLVGIAVSIPTILQSVVMSVVSIFTHNQITDLFYNVFNVFANIWSCAVYIVSCIMFTNYLEKNTGYKGDIQKHKYLYNIIPFGAVSAVSAFINCISTMVYSKTMTNTEDVGNIVVLSSIISGVSLIVSIGVYVLMAYVTAILIRNSVIEDAEKKLNTFKKLAIVVTVSCGLTVVINLISMLIVDSFLITTLVRNIISYGIVIAVAWLPCFVKEGDTKKEKLAFTVLPLISIVDSVVLGLIDLI